jgi:hypothetical protein
MERKVARGDGHFESRETDHLPELRYPYLFGLLAGREAFSGPSLKVDDLW